MIHNKSPPANKMWRADPRQIQAEDGTPLAARGSDLCTDEDEIRRKVKAGVQRWREYDFKSPNLWLSSRRRRTGLQSEQAGQLVMIIYTHTFSS